MTDSGAWTAHGAMGKVYVVVKNGNKRLLFKSHQESMSFIPSNDDPDVIGEEQRCTSVRREPSRTSQARSWTAASTPGHHLKDRSRTKMGTSKGGKAMVGLLLTIAAVIGYCQPWVSTQPRRNIWVTLTNMTGQEAMCLSLASANNPFTTCLVGNPADNKDWTVYLPQAPLEPQELDILGSVTATACGRFNCSGKNQIMKQMVNATLAPYCNASLWCSYTKL
ncbi:uncharacterized protein LOC121062920 [Cygnus olor]|uniref:uncharacterized protein LOC121062920 n=1 Tax=Cygnus olor TaxID=8869 RepID=UPI001ADE3C59|nr:uncharacterized protein LOC121062920 [Cygnus olor]